MVSFCCAAEGQQGVRQKRLIGLQEIAMIPTGISVDYGFLVPYPPVFSPSIIPV